MTDADRGCLSRGAKGKERDLAPIDKIRSPRAALLRPGPAEADSLAVFGFPVAAGLPLLSSSSSPAQPHGANSNRRSQTGLERNEELAQGLPLLAFVCTAKMAQVISNSGHDDMIHDAGLDYYGRRLATCSSDKTIKIFEIEGDTHRLVETLKGHEGAVWCVAWAHPKFGTILASSSYDGKVLIWREQPVSTTSPAGGSSWSKVFDFSLHTASVNMVSWAPHESGCLLACASSDGHVSVIEFRDNSWTHQIFHAHGMGVNAVSWAPAASPGSLISANPGPGQQRRFVTGGSDNAVKIWEYNPETKSYTLTQTLEGHTDWVRDVAWSPSILSKSYIASASQDKTVRIWTSDASNPGQWTSQVLEFDTVLWRVSWSLSGNILAVSGGDNKVSLWKENLKGQWEKVKDIEE